MEREKFSGNLLNQNKGFGRIEPGLRYLSPFIFSCFNHQILVKHWSSLRCFFRVVQRHICAFWSCRKFYMCMDSSCRMICWKVCILYSICSLFEQGKVYFHYRVHLTVYRCMYHRIPRYHRIPVLFISHIMHLSMLCPRGGRPGVPSGFARNFLPQVGIFTILQSPRVGTFDKS
jgi:hypothetical protein